MEVARDYAGVLFRQVPCSRTPGSARVPHVPVLYVLPFPAPSVPLRPSKPSDRVLNSLRTSCAPAFPCARIPRTHSVTQRAPTLAGRCQPRAYFQPPAGAQVWHS